MELPIQRRVGVEWSSNFKKDTSSFYGRDVVLVRNTQDELLALLALLCLAQHKNFTYLHIYGDSKIVVDWVKKRSFLKVDILKHHCDKMEVMKSLFPTLTFSHIYRTFNKLPNKLSKELWDPEKHFFSLHRCLILRRLMKDPYLSIRLLGSHFI